MVRRRWMPTGHAPGVFFSLRRTGLCANAKTGFVLMHFGGLCRPGAMASSEFENVPPLYLICIMPAYFSYFLKMLDVALGRIRLSLGDKPVTYIAEADLC